MRFNTIGYCFKQGFKNIWRNKLFSLASMATMAACIFMFGIFFCIVQNFQHFVREAEEGVAVTVLFDEGTTEDEILEIGQGLTKRDGVSEVVYVSADEAWKSYQEKYFEGNPEVAEAFVDDNPLANSSNLEIYMKDISKQDDLVTYIESLDKVRKVNRSDSVASMLTDFNRLVSYVSVAIIGLLLAVAIFLINNTVAIGISVRREEIGIMRLIGAKNSFIKAPFLIEGIVIGLVGAIFPLILLYFLYNKLITYVGTQFTGLNNVMDFLPAAQLFQTLLPVGMALGVGIGFFGSIVTIQRHLKV
ncbi:ABC transporter permease [Clostridiaceae bacterium OF09-1]|nr:ABC transporter permease [Clostridiaceae bacterium OF09-1]